MKLFNINSRGSTWCHERSRGLVKCTLQGSANSVVPPTKTEKTLIKNHMAAARQAYDVAGHCDTHTLC